MKGAAHEVSGLRAPAVIKGSLPLMTARAEMIDGGDMEEAAHGVSGLRAPNRLLRARLSYDPRGK